MWCKVDSADLTKYNPYLINLETGAEIYVEYMNNTDGEFYAVIYQYPNSENRNVLKKILASWIDEDDICAPLSDVIDNIYEALEQRKNAFTIE